jgi:hypothetical protein
MSPRKIDEDAIDPAMATDAELAVVATQAQGAQTTAASALTAAQTAQADHDALESNFNVANTSLANLSVIVSGITSDVEQVETEVQALKFYDVHGSAPGAPVSNGAVLVHSASREFVLSGTNLDHVGCAEVPSSSTVTFGIWVHDTSISTLVGTMTFAANDKYATFNMTGTSAERTLVKGYRITVVHSAGVLGSMSDISIMLAGTM